MIAWRAREQRSTKADLLTRPKRRGPAHGVIHNPLPPSRLNPRPTARPAPPTPKSIAELLLGERPRRRGVQVLGAHDHRMPADAYPARTLANDPHAGSELDRLIEGNRGAAGAAHAWNMMGTFQRVEVLFPFPQHVHMAVHLRPRDLPCAAGRASDMLTEAGHVGPKVG